VTSATIFEAKTTLSELIKRAQAGETVIITSGRDKVPVAELHAIAPQQAKRLGALYTPGFELGEAFWEPLPAGWEGESDHADDPLQIKTEVDS
jgi:antitoxin (DNA-binding transcriptional repressor) of toxin-antitoxin stability system